MATDNISKNAADGNIDMPMSDNDELYLGRAKLDQGKYSFTPIVENNAAFTACGSYPYSNMGGDYHLGRSNGNGSLFFVEAGNLIPKKATEQIAKDRFQPYVTYSYRDFKGFPKAAQDFQAGVNY